MDAAKFLVASGAKLHLEATDGVNALHFACMRGHHDLARELVNLGANAKAVTYKGENALHFAARTGDVKLISMLLRKQVSALTRSKRGKRPREVAKGEDAIAALRCVHIYTGPHTTAFAWCTPFLKDFFTSRRVLCFSPPITTRFQSRHTSAPFNSTSDAFRLRPDSAAEAKAEEAARRTAEGLRAKGGETTSDGDGEGDGEEGGDVGEIGPAIGPAIGPPGRPMPPPEEEDDDDDDAAAPSIGPSIGPSMPPPRHLREKREIAEVEDAPADALAAAAAAPVSKKAKKANGKPVLSFGDDDP